MSIFQSFLMGGFECADHINRTGDRVNLLKLTAHDAKAREDYASLRATGITTVREGVCWSAVETVPFVFDFGEVKNRIEAAAAEGIQVIWDMCHFGYPDGIYPMHPHFCARFVALCTSFAMFHKSVSMQQLFVVPINEISFLSWHSGEVRGTVPFAVNCGWDIKYHLCMAAIRGIEALKEADPDCRIVLVEPLIKIHPRLGDDIVHVMDLNSHQFQAMDIIAGRMCPELGGREEYLDILGFNYYWTCQWEHGTGTLPWPGTDLRRVPLSDLLADAYTRYRRPLFVSETGHFGEGREEWIDEIREECMKALRNGVHLTGACIYPVIDRPDWDNPDHYHDCGAWDLDENKNRIPHMPSLMAIARFQAALKLQATETANADFNIEMLLLSELTATQKYNGILR
jgi:beta-glucosidase/6-phospho-beta-glucosidase/beta-galactosidase